MSEKNNERLSRKDRYSQERKIIPPGGYISRKINSRQNEDNRKNEDKRIINKSNNWKIPIKREEENNNQSRSSSNTGNNSNDAKKVINNQLVQKRRVSNPIQKQKISRTNNNDSNPNVVRRPVGPNNRQPQRRISDPRLKNKNSPAIRAKRKNMWLRIIKYGLYAISLLVIALFCLCTFWIYQAPAFDSKILDNNTKTTIYDINNNEVAKLGSNIGETLKTKDIPEKMQDAILATEDNRFFEHGAVDYKRLIGAVFSNLTSGFGSQGGSTISQQLIKRTFLDDNKSMKRKIQEAYLAYKLEQNYSKEDIFTMYVNRIYYSDGVYGLKTAANYYYGKELSELTLPQMALLAGMPQHPNTYNPYDNPEAAKARRDTVLYLMQYHNKITAEEAEAAKQTNVLNGIVKRKDTDRVILSSEFDSKYTGYINQVVSELKNSKEYKDYEGDVLNLGLKVYTNFNPKIQSNLSDSVTNNYAGIKQASDISMVVLNNDNSGIVAIYGSKNQKYGGYNIATQSKLQPGSSIKPILAYGPAVEYLGWSTNHIVSDTPISGSQIQNWDRQYHGNITINNALMMSYNIPAIKTYQEVGFSNVQKYAKSVGLEVNDESITTPIGGGSDGYSPLQMAAAYVPFSNGGYYATPKAIKKVYDSDGTEITSFSKEDRTRVIKESTAYIMTSMLRNVLSGTATSAGVSGVDMAVKTGTTTFSEDDANKYNFDINNYAKDSWIIGYTTEYTLSVWQGFDAIDGPTKYMTSADTVKTQVLYRINMQNIVRLHHPSAFKVPSNVGSINGAVKVITNEEKRQLEEQTKKLQDSKNSNSRNNNSNNSDDEDDNNSSNNNNNNNNSFSNNNNRNKNSNNTNSNDINLNNNNNNNNSSNNDNSSSNSDN